MSKCRFALAEALSFLKTLRAHPLGHKSIGPRPELRRPKLSRGYAAQSAMQVRCRRVVVQA